MTTVLPLQGIRVVELTDGLGESAGRFLADLGADVIRVEPPEGTRSRSVEPIEEQISIPFALRNANKRAVALDLEQVDDRSRLRALIATADIVLESQPPGRLESLDLAPATMLSWLPTLVVVSISGFGQTGPYRDWQASEAVIYALSGVLSRSGEPGREPLLPPAGLVEESLGVHAAWSALLAFSDRLDTGAGQLVDISAFESIVHGFDPGFGVQGSAAAGRSEDFPRGRPDATNFYPVLRCADGQVRLCLLARRQWRAMFSWLGEPAEFADPSYDTIPARFAAADRLHPLIEQLFANFTREQLVAEGASRGIPIGGVLDLPEVLTEQHFVEAETFREAEIAPGLTARLPAGYARIDGERLGWRRRAPLPGEHDAQVWAEVDGFVQSPSAAAPTREVGSAPFAGLRVLDLGVVVFGAELGRQFADRGADVIKIENSNFPDGLRQSKRGAALAASVAWGHRNKRSLGLDLRSSEGKDLFRKLAVDADIVLANFKPGTLASMGLSETDLRKLNPRIIVAESSAFGSVGVWNTRLGYGPLVRASCGVTTQWKYSADDPAVCDGSTVYPDHIGAQVSAVVILANLIARTRGSRQAANVEVAQAEAAIVQLGVSLVQESLRPGTVAATGNQDPTACPSGVYAAAGDDEWIVVDVRDDEQWQSLCRVLEWADLAADPALQTARGRVAHRERIDRELAGWLAVRTPQQSMAELQAAGVPAGAMMRLPELLTDPQLTSRSAYVPLDHPLLPAQLPTAVTVAKFGAVPDSPLAPAPLPGEQTREVAREVLALSDDELEAYIAAGVLQPADVLVGNPRT